jgi:hypothetical protein
MPVSIYKHSLEHRLAVGLLVASMWSSTSMKHAVAMPYDRSYMHWCTCIALSQRSVTMTTDYCYFDCYATCRCNDFLVT